MVLNLLRGFDDPEILSMSPTELSSLKWGEDGELSPNDTLNLLERLMKVEEESKRSELNSSPILQQENSQDSLIQVGEDPSE